MIEYHTRIKKKTDKQIPESTKEQQNIKKAKHEIEDAIKKITNILKNINSIKYGNSYIEKINKTEVTGKEIQNKVSDPLWDDIIGTDYNHSDNSIYNKWGEYLSDDIEEKLNSNNFFYELSNIRSQLKDLIYDDINNRNTLKLNIISGSDFEKIKEKLNEIQNYLERLKDYLKDQNNFSIIREAIDFE
ncbi:hypothetical protein [Borreliella bissettiae]|uniref:hypothetical protein n=1 Tax=Borrelia bissettiae TaxID=64897 RepID=UPI0038B3227B